MRSNSLISGVIALATLAVMSRISIAIAADTHPTTPIQHLVVIFQENVSFDHYFATYPKAANPAGEPEFVAKNGTPQVNGLADGRLRHNPNSANPFRLARSEALTCDEDHDYTHEQRAYNGGLADKFVENTTHDTCSAPNVSKQNLVMGYYDGNTVTALWNYAQHFAMSDNSYNTTFGPSTPGALNLVSGQTWGAISTNPQDDNYGVVSPNAENIGTVINDPDPTYDDCSNPKYPHVSMKYGKNVGDLLSDRGVSWGWFEGGFRPSARTADGKAICGSKSANLGGVMIMDYIPHHEPFQYYESTANPHHLPPSSVSMIGKQDQANHQYDLSDFWSALDVGELPAVSFLKAAAYQDGHAGYSDPLDEQVFLVNTINRLQKSRFWNNTAVIIAYDDSDGWYDHVMPPIIKQSGDPSHDAMLDGSCGIVIAGEHQDRCGYGPRLPLLVISPWARQNYVDHSVTDQTSILRFIEDNWGLGRIGDDSFDQLAGSIEGMFDFSHPEHDQKRYLFLDPATGMVNGNNH